MTKTGDSERTTIPAKERTAKDHAKAVGNGLLGVWGRRYWG
jgi:cob(I)alamin adenosyltransferase